MADEYMDAPDVSMMNEAASRVSDGENISDGPKDFGDISGYDENYEDDDGGNNFRNGRGRGNFRGRGRGPPPGWMNGPPMRFRGRGYGPGGPPMRGRGFFRGRGGPRGFGPNNGPNFDNNWGPMGPPPPGMMGGPPPFGPPPGMMPPGGPMGPPPNMMGQPPPFGGPPGMPPPNMPAPELWVETKSEEGKSYYYHARTRETTWTRPQDTPTCKVITQSEMEAMAASGQMPNMGGPQSMPMGGPPMGGPPMGGPPMGMMPNGMMGGMMPPGVAPQTSVPSFMSQPPPWVKDGEDFYKGAKDKNMDEDSPNDNDDMPPGESAPVTSSNGNMNFSNAPPTNFPPGGFPGGPGGPGPGGPGGPGGFPGGWGGWGSWPPPMGPPSMATAAVPEVGAAGQMPQLGGAAPASLPPVSETLIIDSPTHTPVKKDETVIPASVATLAAAWSTHVAPDGRPYYYHAANQESVWEKPKPIRDLEELQAKIAAEKGEKVEKKIDKIEIDDSKIEVIDVEAHAEAAAALEAERAAAAERDRDRDRDRARAAERDRLERERDRERQDQERLDKEKADKEKAKQDRSRPISSTPISGTPWCVVWTGDGRVFFYNPTAHSSVWERPPQLAARADVDKAVTNPPAQLQDLQRKESTTAAATPATVAASSRANGDLKRVADSDSDDSDSDPPKKVKPDDTKKATTTSTGAGNIDLGKEAAIEAEVRAARERAVVPHEQRVRSFTTMLRDKDVSAFSTWEKELQKIVFDPRYLMLDSKERRQVFDQYVRERAEEERKEKKNRLQQKKVAFRALMEEAKLHAKSSYTEFSSKHGRDERFKAIEKPRDRETYFNEFIAEVRKREKEDKEKKREQVKGEFIAMLKEKAVDRRARWAEAKKKVDSEPRYKAVESSTLRDDYFREYCKMVKEERKKEKDVKEKEKERDRSSSKKEKKDKDRDKDKEKEKDKDKDKERDKESKKDKKKEKGGEKTEPAEGERKQPTPPPDQWAEILGIPGEDDSRSKSSKSSKKNPDTSSERSEKSKSESPEPEIRSPKQLRSSKKVASPEKKTLIKTPPKKRKDFKSPEPEKKVVKKKVEKVEKTEKRKRKKSEKE